MASIGGLFFCKKTANGLKKAGVSHRIREALKKWGRNYAHIVLVEPEIPQNTGNIARTCAATGCVLHLVEPLGFAIDDKRMKRAGLDYWHLLDVRMYKNLDEFFEKTRTAGIFTRPPRRRTPTTRQSIATATYLMFGKETKGLPESLLVEHPERCVRIPMREGARSLNLSNSVAVIVFEALRQTGFQNLKLAGPFPQE